MTVTLDAKSEELVRRSIEAGRFREPEEVIARALQVLDSEMLDFGETHAEFEQSLIEAEDEFDRGGGYTGDEVRQMLAEDLKALRNCQL